MAIEKVGVVGAGQMGNGIAHVFARAGYEVVLTDPRFTDAAIIRFRIGTVASDGPEVVWSEWAEQLLDALAPPTWRLGPPLPV